MGILNKKLIKMFVYGGWKGLGWEEDFLMNIFFFNYVNVLFI